MTCKMELEKRFLQITQNLKGATEMDKEMAGADFKMISAMPMKATL